MGGVTSVAFSKDGTILASSGGSGNVGKITLWDISNPKVPVQIGPPLSAHTVGAHTVAFSPDGRTLVSVGGAEGRGEVILWDVSNPRSPIQLGTMLSGHKETVISVAFSRDGKLLASSSADGTIILWDVSVESWIERACRIVRRNLTRDEWAQYLGDEPYHKTCEGWPEAQ